MSGIPGHLHDHLHVGTTTGFQPKGNPCSRTPMAPVGLRQGPVKLGIVARGGDTALSVPAALRNVGSRLGVAAGAPTRWGATVRVYFRRADTQADPAGTDRDQADVRCPSGSRGFFEKLYGAALKAPGAGPPEEDRERFRQGDRARVSTVRPADLAGARRFPAGAPAGVRRGRTKRLYQRVRGSVRRRRGSRQGRSTGAAPDRA